MNPQDEVFDGFQRTGTGSALGNLSLVAEPNSSFQEIVHGQRELAIPI